MSDTSGRKRKPDASYVLAAGVGFLLAAVILLLAIFAFRPEKPVLWPPVSRALAVAAYGLAGTLFVGGLFALVWFVVYIIAIFAGRRTWRDLARRLFAVLIVLVMTGAGLRVALWVFYWPWARASAVHTVRGNPDKWRLLSCGALLAEHWSADVEGALGEGIENAPPEDRAAVAYVLAARGDKAALGRFVAAAAELPESPAVPPATLPPPIRDTNLANQEDILWLLSKLTDSSFDSLAEFTRLADEDLAALAWDPSKGRYILIAQAAPE